MRKLVIATVLAACWATATPASADVGIGLFVGDPLGLDLKIDLERRSALDIVVGTNTYRGDRGGYGHLTYLVTPVMGHGRSVLVPLRLGIGVAVFDDRNRFGDDLNVAARVPLELGLVFRSTPLELYFEVALKMTLVDANDTYAFLDLDGGVGLRFYF